MELSSSESSRDWQSRWIPLARVTSALACQHSGIWHTPAITASPQILFSKDLKASISAYDTASGVPFEAVVPNVNAQSDSGRSRNRSSFESRVPIVPPIRDSTRTRRASRQLEAAP